MGGAGVTSRNHCGHGLEFALRFAAWAVSHLGGPTWQQIAARFGVSRAVAYRYRRAWDAVCESGMVVDRSRRTRITGDVVGRHAGFAAADVRAYWRSVAQFCGGLRA